MANRAYQVDHYHEVNSDPEGKLPSAYELQIVGEKEKLSAVTKLNKAGIPYRLTPRNGSFFITFSNMKDFTDANHLIADENKQV